MPDWNPEHYLKFEQERTQPARDLVARLNLAGPMRIIDLGCGPGNSTAVLKNRWPNARIIGLDSSLAMIDRARKTHAGIEWLHGDANGDLSTLGSFDLVFASASLQWLPNHGALVPRLFEQVNRGGALAVQVPKFEDMPIAHLLTVITETPEFIGFFKGFDSGMHYFDDALYYDVLCAFSREIQLWNTHYYHVLDSRPAVLDWIRSTGMRPYLEQLPEERRAAFEVETLRRIEKQYPAQPDGKVLFVFKRLFFIAYKP